MVTSIRVFTLMMTDNMNKETLKKYAEKAKLFQNRITKEEIINNEPMSEEDYNFERACEIIFHI